MAQKNGYTISDIYQGGYSSFAPNYGDVFTGYHVPASSLGAPTKPDTANQIAEVDKLLRQGMVPIEVGTLRPDVFEAIPKQHFKELKQLAKLTGAKISVHSPLIEPSGIAEGGWSETNRLIAEKNLMNVIEKAHEADNMGNIPVTIHSANIHGTEYVMTPEGKKIERLGIINQETGQTSAIKEEIKYYPSMKELRPEIEEKLFRGEIKPKEIRPEHYIELPLEKGKVYSAEKQIQIANASEWDNALSNLIFNKERADEIIQSNAPQIQNLINFIHENKIESKEEIKNLLNEYPELKPAWNHYRNAETYLEDTEQHLNSLFSRAYKYGTQEQKKILADISADYRENLKTAGENPIKQSQIMQELLEELKTPALAPQTLMPLTEFAMKESAKTFGNVAFHSFKKFGENAPVISIENLYPGFAFSTGKEMNDLILASKRNFADRLVEEERMPRGEAEKQADRVIGLTFDVGHLNLHRKHGFEEEHLKEELKAMSKHIKHLHLTDNFGFYDSHLPPGMGNVPIKEYLEELEKQGFKGRKIVEAAALPVHFGISPYPAILEAMGAPIFTSAEAPYFNQRLGFQQGYSSGYGEMLPQGHYETFGTGFAQLPTELGGQRGGGAGSRFSGRGME